MRMVTEGDLLWSGSCIEVGSFSFVVLIDSTVIANCDYVTAK